MKKLFFLLSLVALIGVSGSAWAQDAATTPFVNSTHTYKVTGTSGNNISFSISSDDKNTSLIDEGGSIFQLVSPPSGGTWTGHVYTVSSAGAEQTFTVKWLSGSAGNTYYLNITETNTTSLCQTTRQLTITPQTNTFDVLPVAVTPTPTIDTSSDGVNDSGSECNSPSGTIIANASSFGTTTTIVFDVQREITSGDPSWKFDWSLGLTGGGVIKSVTFSSATNKASQDVTTGTLATYSNTAVAIPNTATSDKETITVIVENVVNAEAVLTLTTSNGVTNDASAIPDVDTGNNVAKVTLKATPLVGTITAN